MKFKKGIVIAIVLLIGAAVWGVSSLVIRTYDGNKLNFNIGNGPVTVTNTSDQLPLVQLVSTDPGTFTISSSIESLSGKSIRQGSGRDAIQVFEFEIPTGVSEFTVIRGSGVSFVTESDTTLGVTVVPLNADDSKLRLLVVVAVILGSLFYISRSNDHRWISASRRQKASDQAAAAEVERVNFKRIFKSFSDRS